MGLLHLMNCSSLGFLQGGIGSVHCGAEQCSGMVVLSGAVAGALNYFPITSSKDFW